MRLIIASLALLVVSGSAHASSSVTAEELANQPLVGYVNDLEKKWLDFRAEHGLSQGQNPNGVYIAHGMHSTKRVPEEGPAFLRSRINLFYRAYLKAKAKMVKSLGETISKDESLFELENAGDVESLKGLQQAARIKQKSADLEEAELDKALADLDPEYDAGQYDGVPEKLANLEDTYDRTLRTFAVATLVGAMPITIVEGEVEGANGPEYGVLVGLVWSPRMKRDARALLGHHEPVLGPPGPGVEGSLPKTLGQAAASWGVTRTTDEVGNRILISYGQAAVQKVGTSGWTGTARESAKAVAELEAKGALRGFIGETVAASAERDVRDSATLLLLDGSESAEQIEQTRRFYESNAEAVEIVGLDVVGSWIVRHPANNQEMAVVAVKWSGASQKAAQDLKRSMQAAQRDLREKVAKTKSEKVTGRVILQRNNVNKNDL